MSQAIISPSSSVLMTDELAPREPILPVPFDFSIRKYSRWLYPFISRYNYGSQTPYGDWSQVPKAVLKRAMAIKQFRYLHKLTERHLQAHLQETMTYYYTGSRRTNTLLLCVDVDAHEGQEDAPALAEYVAGKFLRNNCYIEPSTHKTGKHVYFLASFDVYTSTSHLFALTKELTGLLEAERERAGFRANIDLDIGGLPSDWKNDKMAHLIKLPRPKTEKDLEGLLALKAMPLEELVKAARALVPSPATSLGSQRHMPHPCGAVPCVSNSIIDCGTLNHESKKQRQSHKHLKPDIEGIKQRNPLYRALWTVQGLARSYGRMPNIAEALNVYDEFGIGTGPCTDRRIRRFESVIAFVARTFDPKKIKRPGFLRQYPFLKRQIEQALERTPANLRYGRRIITLDNLCVALYFAKYQLSRGDEKNNFGTLPIKGIVELSKKVKQDHGMQSIPNQKASACRGILCQLGLLELTDKQYQFWGVRRAKRYRLREDSSK